MLRSQCHHLWKLYAGVARSSQLPAFYEAVAVHTKDILQSHVGLGQPRAYATGSGDDEREINNPKVLDLAAQIMQLNLLEVSDLTELLRKRLNIQTSAFSMPMGMTGVAPSAAAPETSSQATAEPAAAEKTEFTLRLEGFDSASKIKVIKEVRAITDLGLKEAKELVEGAPAVLKEGLSKDVAEQLKAKLESVGAKIQLE